MENLFAQLEQILLVVGVIVSAATLIVAGLEKIAAITPTTKDDEVVGKLKKGLSVVSSVLAKVSVYKAANKEQPK